MLKHNASAFIISVDHGNSAYISVMSYSGLQSRVSVGV